MLKRTPVGIGTPPSVIPAKAGIQSNKRRCKRPITKAILNKTPVGIGPPTATEPISSGSDKTAAIGFDTLKFARKLKAAGVPEQQAEAQAEIMSEAFLMNMDALVTKDYLDARLAEQNARMDTRLAEQGAHIDTRFAEQDARMDARFAAHDTRFAQIDGKFRLVMWMLAVIMASTVIPAIHQMVA